MSLSFLIFFWKVLIESLNMFWVLTEVKVVAFIVGLGIDLGTHWSFELLESIQNWGYLRIWLIIDVGLGNEMVVMHCFGLKAIIIQKANTQ